MGAGLPYLTEAIAQGEDSPKKAKRVIVMSPAIVVEKWEREIKERVPNVKTFIVKNWLDIKKVYDENSYTENGKVKFKEPETFEYYIVSSEAPKASIPEEVDIIELNAPGSKNNRLENAYNYIKINDSIGRTEEPYVKCPSCRKSIANKKGSSRFLEFNDFYRKSGDTYKPHKKVSNSFCRNIIESHDGNSTLRVCGHNFWQPKKNLSKGMRKVSPIWYLNKKFPRGFFKYLILDEAHEFKGSDSLLGKALGQLINHTEKQILLTGTLMGGMASDIYWILAKLVPKKLAADGIPYGGVGKFIEKYGVRELTMKEDSRGVTRTSKRNRPGVNPHLFFSYLIENATFLELNDMGYALPRYEEIPEIVEAHPEVLEAYNEFLEDFLMVAHNIPSGSRINYGFTLISSLYQYIDIPSDFHVDLDPSNRISDDKRYSIREPLDFGVKEGSPNLKDNLLFLTKYQKLLTNIKKELIEFDRKSLVYVEYSGDSSYNRVDTWLYNRLKEEGFKVGILTSGKTIDGIKMPKKSTEREAWLEKMMEKHDWDVLITNPRLVKVGLDLLDFPNIHFYQMNYSTYDYMQASRRSWRIRQDKPVKVYTYAYKDTIQEDILYHMSKKIDASLAIQGKFSEEGLRSMSDSGGINQLAKDLINNEIVKDTSDILASFKKKNQSFEEMQSVEFQDYENYEMNPIEGGIEEVKRIQNEILEKADPKSIKGSTIKKREDATKKAGTSPNPFKALKIPKKKKEDTNTQKKTVSIASKPKLLKKSEESGQLLLF